MVQFRAADDWGNLRSCSGTADPSFLLRSERSPHGNPRIDTVLYTVSDGSGNSAQAVGMVTVPQGQSARD